MRGIFLVVLLFCLSACTVANDKINPKKLSAMLDQLNTNDQIFNDKFKLFTGGFAELDNRIRIIESKLKLPSPPLPVPLPVNGAVK